MKVLVLLAVCVSVAVCGTALRRQECNDLDCSIAKCVDAVPDEDGCCDVCPQGENCIYFGDIVPANQVGVDRLGDCEISCRCPSSYAYLNDHESTTASCSMICGHTYISPSEFAAAYNLLEPFSRKRTFEVSDAADEKEALKERGWSLGQLLNKRGWSLGKRDWTLGKRNWSLGKRNWSLGKRNWSLGKQVEREQH